jgi:transcriptional regulator with XRE-family HTH domain
MMQFGTAFGHAVRKIRSERGMTLRDLSAKSHISLGYLSEVERGSKDASSQVIDCIARGLGISNHELISLASQEMWLEEEVRKISAMEVSDLDIRKVFVTT